MTEREEKWPTCHFKRMEYVFADDGSRQVGFFECNTCGHTKDEDWDCTRTALSQARGDTGEEG